MLHGSKSMKEFLPISPFKLNLSPVAPNPHPMLGRRLGLFVTQE